jgi:hypothetical protein
MVRLAVITALLAGLPGGCGSGGGASLDPAPVPSPAPGPVAATVVISTRAASAATVIYGVEFVLHLPAGVAVSADAATGEVSAGVLHPSDSGAFAGARYLPTTASSQASVKVNIVDARGFAVGDLATLTCTVSSGAAASAAGFSLDGFAAKDSNGANIPEISPHFTLRTQ